MKHVLLYAPGAVDEKAPLHAEAHREWYLRFHERGSLLMIGPFENARREGAMCVFTSREEAEEFARGDPFVLNGVVSSWSVRGWNEVLATP